MLNLVKETFTNKIALLCVMLTILWLLGDYTQRLKTSEGKSQSKITQFKIEPLKEVPLGRVLSKRIDDFLEKYRTAIEEKPNQSLNVINQSEQQGELTSLFVGENKLRLKAVIRDNNKKTLVAMIAVTDLTSNNIQVDKFEHNSELYGYRLNINNNTQVTLTKKDTAQQVILKMYSAK